MAISLHMREQDEGSENQVLQEEITTLRLRNDLLPYHYAFMSYMVAPNTPTDPNNPAHPDRMEAVGNGIRVIRRNLGISREVLAAQMVLEKKLERF